MSEISRREFIRVSALAAAGAAAAACAKPAEPTAAPEEPAAPTPKPEEPKPEEAAPGREAPILAELVEAGSLPPVAERLPKDVRVQPVEEEIGDYGGTWHRVAVGRAGDCRVGDRLTYQNPVRWKGAMDVSEVLPNNIESWEINDDATVFTFHMREGMKFSDGAPFTSEDWVFWYEDWLLNDDLSGSFPSWLSDPAQGEPMVLEGVDDYTFKVTYATPYGLWLQILAGSEGRNAGQRACKHWLSQFHADYADKAELEAKMKAADFENWWELFGDKTAKNALERPRIWAWTPTQMPPDIPIVHDRNPYYYKTDPEGNQLPYIDQMVHEIVENADMMNMKAVAGEIDMQLRHIMWTNYPLFVENAEQGDYRILEWELAEGSNFTVVFNYNHKDPVFRDLYANKDFRIALSLAINRSEINEIAYMGFGKPRQSCLSPGSPYFKPEHATRYAEYDPDKANEILDGILPEKDSEGYRLRPDGDRFTVVYDFSPVFGPWRDVLEMLTKQWADIGIHISVNEIDRSLRDERIQAGEQDIGCWTQDRNYTPLLDPEWFCPPIQESTGAAYYQWAETRGEEGEEPPPEMKAQLELYWKIQGAKPGDLPPLAEEFFDRASENLWYIGVVGELPHVGVCKNNFRNVPERGISDWLQLTPGNGATEQFFFKQG